MARKRTHTFPFPSGGLNAREDDEDMPETDARQMINIIPRGGYGEIAPASLVFHDAQGSGANVKSIIVAPYTDTGEKVFVCYGGKIVYILTSTTETELETGQTSDLWQHAMINNTLVMVNGADQPQQISSTPTSSDATYTGISDDAKLVDVCQYRGRLFFIEKDTLNLWYAALGSTTGGLTQFDLKTIVKKGGTLTWLASWTQDTGSGLSDYLILMTSQGEMLVYAGDDPGVSFYLMGRFFVGKPMSRRAKANVGKDLWFLTKDGMISARDVFQANGKAGKYKTITDKVQNLYRELATTLGTEDGWEIFPYPQLNLIIVNVPPTVAVDGQYGRQLAMNSETGAWCEFQDLHSAWCWGLWGESALFGGRGATGQAFNPSGSSAPGNYRALLWWAFSDLGADGYDKLVHEARPTLSHFEDFDGGSGSLEIRVGVIGGPSSLLSSEVTVATHTAAEGNFSRWVGAGACARDISPQMRFVVDDIKCRINKIQIGYEISGEPL